MKGVFSVLQVRELRRGAIGLKLGWWEPERLVSVLPWHFCYITYAFCSQSSHHIPCDVHVVNAFKQGLSLCFSFGLLQYGISIAAGKSLSPKMEKSETISSSRMV